MLAAGACSGPADRPAGQTATVAAGAAGAEGCAGRPGTEIPAVHADPVVIPEAEVGGTRVPSVTVPGVDLPAQRIPAACVPQEEAPAGCLAGVTITGVTIPGVTIPAVSIPGVSVPGLRVDPVSTPAVSVAAVSGQAVSTPGVCAVKVRSGLRPAVVRSALVRASRLRRGLLRPSVVRPPRCLSGGRGCVPAVAVPAVAVPAVAVPAVAVPAAVLEAKYFPELGSAKVRVLEGGGSAAYSLQADLLFDFNKAAIRPDAAAELRRVVASIRRRFPGRRLRVDGHTDAKGSDAFNLALSRRRAEAVADWLAGHWIDRALLTTKGFGETRPVAPNRRAGGADNPAGRQQNRRVVIGVERG